MSICLFTEVKRQWAMLVLGWVTTSMHTTRISDSFALMLLDQNPFWPCFNEKLSLSETVLVTPHCVPTHYSTSYQYIL